MMSLCLQMKPFHYLATQTNKLENMLKNIKKIWGNYNI